jgi:iron(III) transport system substrate-binding protein
LVLLVWLSVGCQREPQPTVVVYAAQDQVYAEPILNQFSKETGIQVRAVFDSEAVKTVGIANRLLAERQHPQCDVFWGNEELRTRQLAARDVFRETNGWAAFGYRSRRIVINTNQFSLANAPRQLAELTNAVWRGKVALAYPLFGTTATHFLALRRYWGETNWLNWCRALQAHQPLVVDGNSVVVRLVGRGEASIGLTDSDDIAAGQREGLPVVGLPLSEEALLIPNTVAVIRNAPHPSAAQDLFIYLQQPAVAEQLVAANALEGHLTSHVTVPTLQPDWQVLLEDREEATAQLKEMFLR